MACKTPVRAIEEHLETCPPFLNVSVVHYCTGVGCALNNFCKLYILAALFLCLHLSSTLFLLLVKNFSRLSRKLIVFDPIGITFNHRISPESLSV
jgi:hypothetical protein